MATTDIYQCITILTFTAKIDFYNVAFMKPLTFIAEQMSTY